MSELIIADRRLCARMMGVLVFFFFLRDRVRFPASEGAPTVEDASPLSVLPQQPPQSRILSSGSASCDSGCDSALRYFASDSPGKTSRLPVPYVRSSVQSRRLTLKRRDLRFLAAAVHDLCARPRLIGSLLSRSMVQPAAVGFGCLRQCRADSGAAVSGSGLGHEPGIGAAMDAWKLYLAAAGWGARPLSWSERTLFFGPWKRSCRTLPCLRRNPKT